ncbi:hypothetical protein PIB30_106373, partial [Stylosanthes scabra]|nr:hypothetical protein [Stylosanthes scabra]
METAAMMLSTAHEVIIFTGHGAKLGNQDIKRSNRNIQAEQILLKSMIERVDSLFFNPDLKKIARHMKNSKINPTITHPTTYKVLENHKKVDPKSTFEMDMDQNVCLDVSDDDDDVLE